MVSAKEEKPLVLVEKDAPVCPSVDWGSSALSKKPLPELRPKGFLFSSRSCVVIELLSCV